MRSTLRCGDGDIGHGCIHRIFVCHVCCEVDCDVLRGLHTFIYQVQRLPVHAVDIQFQCGCCIMRFQASIEMRPYIHYFIID